MKSAIITYPKSRRVAVMPAAIAARLEPFGTPRLRVDGAPMRLGSRKALGLAIVLALEGPQTRERLCALLWPDADLFAARRNLRRDLFRLREAGLPLAENVDGALALDCAVEFDRDGTAGPALQGLGGLAGTEFEAWLAQVRAQLETDRCRMKANLVTSPQSQLTVSASSPSRRLVTSKAVKEISKTESLRYPRASRSSTNVDSPAPTSIICASRFGAATSMS